MASTFTHLKIPLEEIQRATNNFADENIIGKGGFGNVYKGQVTHRGEPTNIAARRLDRRHGQGDVEFWTEISALSSVKNNYIVEFIGYVDEKDEKIIINRDYAKGSLVMYLSDPTLTWSQRLYISLYLVIPINYIHHELDEQGYYIIHRNINSFTILLDDDWKPRLSGFEFSLKHPEDRRNQIFLCDKAIGTRGYMDPSDLKYGGVTHKSDIYSFGVVLFELLCGMKAKDGRDNKLLASLAKFHFENGTLQDVIHPDLWNQMDPESVKNFSEAAYSCINKERAQRPNVKQVHGKLLEALRFQERYEVKKAAYEKHEKDIEYKKDAEDESDTNYKDEDDEKYKDKPSFHKVLENLKHLEIRLEDIELATDNFSKKYRIGWDISFNNLYKAELECIDKEYLSTLKWKRNTELPKRRYIVVIKDIHRPDDEVYHEIEILSNCKHHNIQSLLGFCKKGRGMILVYEYVSTRRLNHYSPSGVLTWEKRLNICLDIAHGLNYLHHEMKGQKAVIHRCILSNNIELDDDWEATITDFRESIYLPLNQDDDALYVDALHGFSYDKDPEYLETGKLKRESDIYSFGAIMFEILCGGIPPLTVVKKSGSLGKVMWEWLDKGIIYRKVSPILKGENSENNLMLNKGPNKESLETFINIASQCLAEKQNQRPTMKIIIKELKKALSLQENNKDFLRMSLEDIKLATQNFSRANGIGRGGFGRVFKGEVAKKDGNGYCTIVVKQLDTTHGQGEKQFYNELQILYEYKHENIIDLVGYCNETNEKVIVYEHAPKGSLDKYLSDNNLTWKNRLTICIDFATGLDFLHGGGHGQEVVIHRDIKAANILLFDDWKTKVGDFGLSVISTINKESNYIIDHACGTKGYMDPLYLKLGFLTLESDIYSFGVVLFEILCGRTTFEIHKYMGQFLPSFIKHIFKEGKQDEVVFHAIKDEIVPKSLTTFQNIAYQCLEDDREKRPTSKEVLAQLKKAMAFQVAGDRDSF